MRAAPALGARPSRVQTRTYATLNPTNGLSRAIRHPAAGALPGHLARAPAARGAASAPAARSPFRPQPQPGATRGATVKPQAAAASGLIPLGCVTRAWRPPGSERPRIDTPQQRARGAPAPCRAPRACPHGASHGAHAPACGGRGRGVAMRTHGQTHTPRRFDFLTFLASTVAVVPVCKSLKVRAGLAAERARRRARHLICACRGMWLRPAPAAATLGAWRPAATGRACCSSCCFQQRRARPFSARQLAALAAPKRSAAAVHADCCRAGSRLRRVRSDLCGCAPPPLPQISPVLGFLATGLILSQLG